VSLSSHVAADILTSDSASAIWAQIMIAGHLRTGIWAIGAFSALILFFLSMHPAHHLGGDAMEAGAQLVRGIKFAILQGYKVAPALMLGLAFAIGFPLIALASPIIRTVSLSADATRRYRPGKSEDFQAEVDGDQEAVRSGHPFVEIPAEKGVMRCPIPHDMLRIGREDDNDIRIASSAVHRYHAAIYREDYNDWHIADLSGVEGNGLIVNGRRCCEARLNDGDLIQLGPGKLRFHLGNA
jgi:hypothetical protein